MSRTFLPHVITDDSALGGKVIERSLRFRSGSSSNLEKINSSAGNRRTMTYSFWFKRVKINFQTILRGKQAASDRHGLDLLSDGGFRFWGNAYNASPLFHVQPSRLLRDLNAWYHLVLSIDTTQSTASDRVKFYINGDLITDFGTTSYPDQNESLYLNDACRQTWGVEDGGIDIYFADIHFIDGYQYDASYFGYTESQTGIWRPKKYEGTYQDNSYHLDFSDPTSLDTLGIDKSPLGNDYAAEGFQVSAGYNQDTLLDTPTKEYSILNNLHHNSTNTTFSNGNLYASIPASNTNGKAFGTIPIKTGKWYWEVLYNQAGGNGDYLYVGLCDSFATFGGGTPFYRAVRGADGEQYPNTGSTEVRFTTNDIINVAVDLDAGKWYIGRNGTYWYSGDPVAGTGFVHSDLISANASTTTEGLIPFFYNATSAAGQQFSVNFGQRPFSYTPPSGFKEINLSNLPLNVPSIIRPQKHFDTILYTGNGSSQTIGGLEFAPDWVWIKIRSQSYDHAVFDTIRGATKDLETNQTSVEQTRQMLTAFTSNGFSVGNDTQANKSGDTFVAWCWKAGGTAVTNNDGSIASQVSVNEEAGFSIISYTGNNTNNATVGHGLGKTPALLITKSRDNVINPAWHTSHVSLPTNYDIALDASDAAWNPGTNGWHELTNSSVFTLKKGSSDGNNTNRNGDRYIAYCWAEIPGYSKFGSYTGNGNADGAYVHLGFRPSWVLFKRSDSSGNWFIVDNKRDPFNECTRDLYPNTSGTETNNSNFVDFLSDGFKLRTTGTAVNGSGGTYIYMAIAEQPGLTPYDTQTNAR